ncbi:hypothetical protein [Methylovorus mays]|uniref:hypothetical protein n=1 Tax=Methylovorus mays TaxID=184077 RepID=UPI001E28DFDD|nr:hypothetical protein [Methylovorus mays]MCB5206206.1 hypothetical protein [Methylovorus mays]
MQTKQYNLTIRVLYASCAGLYQEHQKNIMPPADGCRGIEFSGYSGAETTGFVVSVGIRE